MELKYNLSFSELMDFFCDTGHQGFSMEEIGEAEKRLGVSFPQSYRDYLSRYGKDKVNTYHHQMMEPQKIYSSYELIQEDLADEWVGEYREAVEQGRESEYAGDPYFRLWQMPVEHWDTVTQDYIILWYENQGVWSAGYRRKDLADGILNPPVYISTNDDYVTYAKCADDTERFLVEMLRGAAYGWKKGNRFTNLAEINASSQTRESIWSTLGKHLEMVRVWTKGICIFMVSRVIMWSFWLQTALCQNRPDSIRANILTSIDRRLSQLGKRSVTRNSKSMDPVVQRCCQP